MFRIIALVAAMGATAFTAQNAGAHPPDINGSYHSGSFHGAHASRFGSGYRGGYVNTVPTYSAPTYSAPRYSAPRYSAPTYNAPTYSGSSYSAPTYGYSSTYRPRARYRAYVSNPYFDRPRNPYGHRSFGPYSQVPTTEGFNFGFSGGPTFGTDEMPVINGVRLRGAPD